MTSAVFHFQTDAVTSSRKSVGREWEDQYFLRIADVFGMYGLVCIKTGA